jgi:hypothetical protein
VETDAPNGHLERAQPEESIAGEYPRKHVVSVFVDGYLHVERAETWKPEHLVDEQLVGFRSHAVTTECGAAVHDLEDRYSATDAKTRVNMDVRNMAQFRPNLPVLVPKFPFL